MSFTSFPDLRMTVKGVIILPKLFLMASAPAIYNFAAPLTQKLEECKTFLAGQHLFDFLVNSWGGSARMTVKKEEEKKVGTNLASWSGGHRDWCRVQSGGSSGWSSARSRGTVKPTGDSQTGYEDWTEGTERPQLG